MATESKEHILQKTFFLLLTKGYDGVSITDIQIETGMSRGLLYHYFGNKEELFRVVAETFLVDLFLTYPDQGKEYGLLEMIGYVVKRYKEIHKGWSHYLDCSKITIANYDFLMYQMIEKDKKIADKYKEMRHKEAESWKKAAKRSLQIGEINAILNEQQIVNHIIAILDGIWMQAVEKGDRKRYINQIGEALMNYYQLLTV